MWITCTQKHGTNPEPRQITVTSSSLRRILFMGSQRCRRLRTDQRLQAWSIKGLRNCNAVEKTRQGTEEEEASDSRVVAGMLRRRLPLLLLLLPASAASPLRRRIVRRPLGPHAGAHAPAAALLPGRNAWSCLRGGVPRRVGFLGDSLSENLVVALLWVPGVAATSPGRTSSSPTTVLFCSARQVHFSLPGGVQINSQKRHPSSGKPIEPPPLGIHDVPIRKGGSQENAEAVAHTIPQTLLWRRLESKRQLCV
jgi:hypothetical protein